MLTRLIVRRLLGAWRLTAFSILTLAVGVGMTTATYSVLATIQGGSEHMSAQCFRVRLVAANRSGRLSHASFSRVRAEESLFPMVAAAKAFSTGLTIGERSEVVAAEAATGAYFEVIGVRPLLGRPLQPADDDVASSPVAMLGYTAWRRYFNSDPSVIGRVILVNGKHFSIVGVAPRGFAGAAAQAFRTVGLWIPLTHMPSSAVHRTAVVDDPYRPEDLNVFVRLAPGIASTLAEQRLQSIFRDIDRAARQDKATGYAAPRASLDEARAGTVDFGLDDAAPLVAALPTLVLLIACTNIANLALSRGVPRQQEHAVRRALGTSRWALIKEESLEGLVIAIAGGGIGIWVAAVLAKQTEGAFAHFAGTPFAFASFLSFELDGRAVATAASLAMLAFLVAGVVPAIELTRVRESLTRHLTGTPCRWRGRANLIAVQVWVSMCLLLLTASAVRVVLAEHRSAQYDIKTNTLAQVDIPFGTLGYDATAARRVSDKLVTTLAYTPGIKHVALRSQASGWSIKLSTAQINFADAAEGVESASLTLLTSEGFSLLGIPLVYGRPVGEQHNAGQRPAIVINESLAHTLTGRANAVGTILRGRVLDFATKRWMERDYEIVGISGDIRRGRSVQDNAYMSLDAHYTGEISIIVEGRSVADAVATTRAVVRNETPTLAVSYAGRFEPQRWAVATLGRFIAWSAAALGLTALFLAMTGLFGALSHIVQKRTTEIGIRMALGADRRQIVTLVLRDGFRPVLEGLVMGTVTAFVAIAILRSMVVGSILGVGGISVGLIGFVYLVAALIACAEPAVRASRVQPNVAIREP